MCLKRFKESRSRWIYPAFPEHDTVFCGAWGIASTSRKTIYSPDAEWMVFRICIYRCIACYYCKGYEKQPIISLFSSRKQCVCVHKPCCDKSRKQCLWRAICENTQFCLRVFQLVGKSPKPLESQVPCELRTLRALYFSLRIHSVSLPGILQDNLSEGNPFRTFRYMDFTISDYDLQHTCLIT